MITPLPHGPDFCCAIPKTIIKLPLGYASFLTNLIRCWVYIVESRDAQWQKK